MVAGAGHQWPGSLVLRSGVNATSDAFDATEPDLGLLREPAARVKG